MNRVRERILVVDDAAETREVLQRTLSSRGYAVHTASGVAEAVDILDHTTMDLVLTDLRMPQVSGLDLIRYVRENFECTAVMMMTGYASIETAVSAVREGAEDYLPKPFTDEELFQAVDQSLTKLRARRAATIGQPRLPDDTFGLIGTSPGMQSVASAIRKSAAVNATVLITGESGTGKELVARAIHYQGTRTAAPFVPVNCAGIPEGLVESELFGHVRGAFTGATTTRAGFFITADKGTIFLDEIGELTAATQAKILRVLEDHHVQMVGAGKSREVDVRIIAATNKDLEALVRKGAFREDLYFRLNVITIKMPPLYERGDDILLLVRHFATRFARQNDKPVPRFSDRALEAVRSYNWPGNVRELENLMQRLVVMGEAATIDVIDLPSLMRYTMPHGRRELKSLAEVEAEHIRFVMERLGGNKTRAAETLGVDRKTLREKLKNLDRPKT